MYVPSVPGTPSTFPSFSYAARPGVLSLLLGAIHPSCTLSPTQHRRVTIVIAIHPSSDEPESDTGEPRTSPSHPIFRRTRRGPSRLPSHTARARAFHCFTRLKLDRCSEFHTGRYSAGPADYNACHACSPPQSPSAGRPGYTLRLLESVYWNLPCLARDAPGYWNWNWRWIHPVDPFPSHSLPTIWKGSLAAAPKTTPTRAPSHTHYLWPTSLHSIHPLHQPAARCPPLPASILPFFQSFSTTYLGLPSHNRSAILSPRSPHPFHPPPSSASACPASIDVAVVPASSRTPPHHTLSRSSSSTMNHVAMAPTDEQLDRDWQPNGRRPQS